MVLLRTPHRITLYYGYETPKFNPRTGKYESPEYSEITLPCMVSVMTNQKVYEEYGNRTDKVISVRFLSEVENFTRAEYDGEEYELIADRDPLRKEAIHMRRVAKSDGV